MIIIPPRFGKHLEELNEMKIFMYILIMSLIITITMFLLNIKATPVTLLNSKRANHEIIMVTKKELILGYEVFITYKVDGENRWENVKIATRDTEEDVHNSYREIEWKDNTVILKPGRHIGAPVIDLTDGKILKYIEFNEKDKRDSKK